MRLVSAVCRFVELAEQRAPYPRRCTLLLRVSARGELIDGELLRGTSGRVLLLDVTAGTGKGRRPFPVSLREPFVDLAQPQSQCSYGRLILAIRGISE